MGCLKEFLGDIPDYVWVVSIVCVGLVALTFLLSSVVEADLAAGNCLKASKTCNVAVFHKGNRCIIKESEKWIQFKKSECDKLIKRLGG